MKISGRRAPGPRPARPAYRPPARRHRCSWQPSAPLPPLGTCAVLDRARRRVRVRVHRTRPGPSIRSRHGTRCGQLRTQRPPLDTTTGCSLRPFQPTSPCEPPVTAQAKRRAGSRRSRYLSRRRMPGLQQGRGRAARGERCPHLLRSPPAAPGNRRSRPARRRLPPASGGRRRPVLPRSHRGLTQPLQRSQSSSKDKRAEAARGASAGVASRWHPNDERGLHPGLARSRLAPRDGGACCPRAGRAMRERPACKERWPGGNIARRLDGPLDAAVTGYVEVATRHPGATDVPASLTPLTQHRPLRVRPGYGAPGRTLRFPSS